MADAGAATQAAAADETALPRVTVDMTLSPFDVPSSQAELALLTTNARSTAWTFDTQSALAWWPHADLFAARMRYEAMPAPIPGSVEVFGGDDFAGDGRGVVWLVNAVYPCPPNPAWSNDTRAKRVHNFKEGLNKLADLVKHGVTLTRLLVPHGMGCLQHMDDWPLIQQALSDFAVRLGIEVLVTKSLTECGNQAPYERLPSHEPLPQEAAFRARVLGLVAPNKPVVLSGGGGAGSLWKSMQAEDKAAAQASSNAMLMDGGMFALLAATTPATQQAALHKARERAAASSSAAAAALGASGGSSSDDSDTSGGSKKSLKRGRSDSMDSGTSRASSGSGGDGGGRNKVRRRAPWTCDSWKAAHVTTAFTPEVIAQHRTLVQGSDAWLQSNAKKYCLTTSKFGAVHRAMNGGSATDLNKVTLRQLWGSSMAANKYMQWGSFHEDDGKGAFAAAAAAGLMQELIAASQGEQAAPPPVGELFAPTGACIQRTNGDILAWSRQAAAGGAALPYTVEERMDSRGVNIDVEDKVLAYSHDGIYTITPADGGKPLTVLIEVKCTQTLLTEPRPDHMCQMMGMMGGLRKQDLDIDYCVYVNWQRQATRFWLVPFDATAYAQLRREMLYVWHNFLLPLFVARDNGVLPHGSLDVPSPMDDISVSLV